MQDGTLGVLADTTAHWASIDPHLFLFIFLPPLIYEGTIAVGRDDCNFEFIL